MPLDVLDPRTSALLVVDMQNAFLHDNGTLGLSGVDTKRLSAIIPAVKDLVECCQRAAMPVLWTVQEHVANDASRARKRLAPHTARRTQISALANTWDAAIVDDLRVQAEVDLSRVIRKHRFGAFHQTRLEMLLAMLGTRTLFIVGTTANACVETTIREAYLRDFDIVAVIDCISGISTEWEQAAHAVWQRYFCELSNSSDVKRWLEQQASPRTLAYGHMLLMVENMERSTTFYVDLLGFKIRPAKPLADGRPFTAFQQGIALVEGRQPGHRQVDHIAFEVNDVRRMRDRLKQGNVRFFQDLHDGPYGLTIYVSDPDDTKVELYQVGATALPGDKA